MTHEERKTPTAKDITGAMWDSWGRGDLDLLKSMGVNTQLGSHVHEVIQFQIMWKRCGVTPATSEASHCQILCVASDAIGCDLNHMQENMRLTFQHLPPLPYRAYINAPTEVGRTRIRLFPNSSLP